VEREKGRGESLSAVPVTERKKVEGWGGRPLEQTTRRKSVGAAEGD
jgi:hypothetical protein